MRGRETPRKKPWSVFDVRAIFSKNCVDDVAKLTGDRAETGTVVLAFGTLALVESAEIRIEADSDI